MKIDNRGMILEAKCKQVKYKRWERKSIKKIMKIIEKE